VADYAIRAAVDAIKHASGAEAATKELTQSPSPQENRSVARDGCTGPWWKRVLARLTCRKTTPESDDAKETPEPTSATPWEVSVNAPRWSAAPWEHEQARHRRVVWWAVVPLTVAGFVLGGSMLIVTRDVVTDDSLPTVAITIDCEAPADGPTTCTAVVDEGTRQALAIGGWVTVGLALVLAAGVAASLQSSQRLTFSARVLPPPADEKEAASTTPKSDTASPVTSAETPATPNSKTSPAPVSLVGREPVLLGGGLQSLLAAGLTFTGVGPGQQAAVLAASAAVIAVATRSRVTSLAAPKDDDQTPLVPAK
jgi:hypothetical protein